MTTVATVSVPVATKPELRAGDPLAPEDFQAIRQRMMLHHCKWDPQVGDTGTLEPFPLLLRDNVWRRLAGWAESLAAETLAAEAELLTRPELHRMLAIPKVIRRVLKRIKPVCSTPRVMRFDFHPTHDGWRISEVNSDVPGGYTEASSFTHLIAAHVDGSRPAGDPAAAWADAITRTASEGGAVALLSAVGFMEDQQITAYLASLLSERGINAHLVGPAQLRCHDGRVYVDAVWHRGPVNAIVRFYQAEWMAALPTRLGWHDWHLSRTPVLNPLSAILTESKRLPLVWSELNTPLPTWRALLPETRSLRQAPWRRDDSWVIKSAFCNTGDTVGTRDLRTPSQWRSVCRSAFWSPGQWVAQRRFEATSVRTPAGERYPCLGVYTIDGRDAGIYGRLAARPLIDFNATDVAVLVEEPSTLQKAGTS